MVAGVGCCWGVFSPFKGKDLGAAGPGLAACTEGPFAPSRGGVAEDGVAFTG